MGFDSAGYIFIGDIAPGDIATIFNAGLTNILFPFWLSLFLTKIEPYYKIFSGQIKWNFYFKSNHVFTVNILSLPGKFI